MAVNYYGDAFSTTGIATSLTDVTGVAFNGQKKLSAGLGGARNRYKRGAIVIGTGAVATDVLRLIRMKSGDRLHSLMLSTSGSTACAGHIGLYKSGFAGDGAVIDQDLFAATLTMNGTIARVDQFKQATTLKDIDRGKTLWEQETIGAATVYTSDPMEDWDICVTLTTAPTVTLITIVLEAVYTAGD